MYIYIYTYRYIWYHISIHFRKRCCQAARCGDADLPIPHGCTPVGPDAQGTGQMKTIGKPWESHGKTMGKPYENHMKTIGTWSFTL